MRSIVERLIQNRMKLHEAENISTDKYKRSVEKILNYRLGNYETGVKVEDILFISSTPETVTLKVEYEVRVRIPYIEDNQTQYEEEVEYRTQTMTLDVKDLD